MAQKWYNLKKSKELGRGKILNSFDRENIDFVCFYSNEKSLYNIFHFGKLYGDTTVKLIEIPSSNIGAHVIIAGEEENIPITKSALEEKLKIKLVN